MCDGGFVSLRGDEGGREGRVQGGFEAPPSEASPSKAPSKAPFKRPPLQAPFKGRLPSKAASLPEARSQAAPLPPSKPPPSALSRQSPQNGKTKKHFFFTVRHPRHHPRVLSFGGVFLPRAIWALFCFLVQKSLLLSCASLRVPCYLFLALFQSWGLAIL